MTLSAILFGLALVYIAIHYHLKRCRKYEDINRLPGPSALEIIRQLLGGTTAYDKYMFISTLNEKYGPVAKLWIKPFSPRIIVADLEYFSKIFMSKVHLNKSNTYEVVRLLVDGLGTTNNIEEWKKIRKICNTAFQHSTVTGFLPIISEYTHTVMEMLRNRTGQVVETQALIHLYTLDVMFEIITKKRQSFMENKNSAYLNARSEYFEILTERLYSLLLMNDFIFRFSKYYKGEQRSLSFMRNYTRKIIEKELTEGDYTAVDKTKSYLIDVLIGNNIDKDTINNHINVFILAGNDPVGQTLCFTLYQLAREPSMQEKVFKEVTTIVGLDKYTEITNNHLLEMKYIECVIKEVTRFFPIIPLLERKLSADENINGTNYPKGTTFMFNIDSVHKSDRYFKNPNKFDPDRFMPENAHLLEKNSFLTFSIGPRDCIGKLLAMLFMKYFVAKIIQNFVVKPVGNHTLKLKHELIVTSLTGVPVIFEERP